SFSVVAEASKKSSRNSDALDQRATNYIGGARLGHISEGLLEKIDRGLPRENGSTLRVATPNGDLRCSFSSVRKKKDRQEMERQLERARFMVDNPGKNRKLKFTKAKGGKLEDRKSVV